jgi:F1F0 ATPase subunit 2
MPTTDLATLTLCALAGVALGGFFFGGLWWTVRALAVRSPSALLQLGSLLLRMGVTLLGFYLVGGSDAGRLLACLAGFVIARVLVARWVRTAAVPAIAMEVPHETRP